MKYSVLVGIEHLFTGYQLMGKDAAQVFEIQRETATTLRILSDSPFDVYWTAKQVFMGATLQTEIPSYKNANDGLIGWYAQDICQKLNSADILYDNLGFAIPPVQADALKRKFGPRARDIRPSYDSIGKCYLFTHAGMLHGIEEDGYIHT